MKVKLERDRQKRMVVRSYELKRRRYKAMLIREGVSESVREVIKKKFTKLPRDSSPSRVRNRCVFTGRARGVQRIFRISRMQVQKFVKEGKIPGLRKASW